MVEEASDASDLWDLDDDGGLAGDVAADDARDDARDDGARDRPPRDFGFSGDAAGDSWGEDAAEDALDDARLEFRLLLAEDAREDARDDGAAAAPAAPAASPSRLDSEGVGEAPRWPERDGGPTRMGSSRRAMAELKALRERRLDVGGFQDEPAEDADAADGATSLAS